MSAHFGPADSDNTKLGDDASTDGDSLETTIETAGSGIVAQPAAPDPTAPLPIDVSSASHITAIEL